MTKKHFVWLSDFYRVYINNEEALDLLVDFCNSESKYFDEQTFRDACIGIKTKPKKIKRKEIKEKDKDYDNIDLESLMNEIKDIVKNI